MKFVMKNILPGEPTDKSAKALSLGCGGVPMVFWIMLSLVSADGPPAFTTVGT